MTYALREARPGTPGTLPARISPSRAVPDQFGRRWDGDDGSSPMPKAPTGWPTPRQSCKVGTPVGAASRVTC